MLRAVVCLMLALQSIASSLTVPENRVVFAMKTGLLLRAHVVAQDDTEAMQRLKLHVRDAVCQTYEAQRPSPCPSMLLAAQAMLPDLREAAISAARREGFTGNITVAIEVVPFDERRLDGYTFPAGDYPALMIRLGDARGHNWWGLIDPELSLRAAALPGGGQDGPTQWDWSLRGLLAALLGIPMNGQEASDA